MAPTLYMAHVSCPSRSVLMCAKAIGLNLNTKILNLLQREQWKPEFLKINPQHTVPTLEEEDGYILWDSHAIMPYLIGRYAKDKSLYPSDLRIRAVVDQRLHFDCSILASVNKTTYRSIVYGGAKEVNQESKNAIEDGLQIVEKFLEDTIYIASNEMTIADFSCALSVLALSVFVPIEATKYPKTTAWLKKIKNLSYFEEVNKQGMADHTYNVKTRLEQNQKITN